MEKEKGERGKRRKEEDEDEEGREVGEGRVIFILSTLVSSPSHYARIWARVW